MIKSVPFALYDAFTDKPFGGSPAGVISDAAAIDSDTRRRIAKEIGAPATSFVSDHGKRSVSARFLSTVMELPMCGHGTICLMTRMVELGLLELDIDTIDVELHLPSSTARVEISPWHKNSAGRDDRRPLVMLDIQPPDFRSDDLDKDELAAYLGISETDFSTEYSQETAVGDFVHLVVPVDDLAVMGRIQPDFAALTRFCKANGIETVAAFSSQVEQPGYTLHVRDFCPAVGVAESAAAGTTNAALTSYLIRHGLVQANSDGHIEIKAEQGHEIDRPSTIQSVASVADDTITRLQVGGVASKILDGQLHLPES